MQFTFVLSLFFMMISAVVALPSGHTFMRASCTIGDCVVALAPTVVSCVGAAAQDGANLIADAGCLAGAVNAAVNIPASCQPCLAEFNISEKVQAVESKVASAAQSVESEASSVVGDVEGELSSIF